MNNEELTKILNGYMNEARNYYVINTILNVPKLVQPNSFNIENGEVIFYVDGEEQQSMSCEHFIKLFKLIMEEE